jgi:uncharacterized protein (DUF1684 family)
MTNYTALRREKDDFFAHHPQSPLTPEQRAAFEGLRYFEPNPALDLTLTVDEFPVKETFEMQTSTGDIQTYRRFGKIRFSVDGEPAELTIYAAPHGFFLPFVDSLANVETYGAGRYLDPEILPDGRLHVDFNLAYNPYCAYNEMWSCPLTPFENRLKAAVRAGEMNFGSPDR